MMLEFIDTRLHMVYNWLYWFLPGEWVEFIWKYSGAHQICNRYDKTMTGEDE